MLDANWATPPAARLLNVESETPNLFSALFDSRPREDHLPRENFLSEAFRYILQSVEPACDGWLSAALGRPVSFVERPEILTREAWWNSSTGTMLYPDMVVRGRETNGRPLLVAFEHKWESPCRPNQLRDYHRLATDKDPGAELIFVGAYPEQVRAAKGSLPRMKERSFLWEDAWRVLASLPPPHPPLLTQFLDFMKRNALSPGTPLSVGQMCAYLNSVGFIPLLNRYAQKLHAHFDWKVLPPRFRETEGEVKDRWGRVGVEFAALDWIPAISMGFLYDTADHAVAFVDPTRGIDLYLRIEVDPKAYPKPSACLRVLRAKADRLRMPRQPALIKGEPGNGNDHTLFISQASLADLIEGRTTESEQFEAIEVRLAGWLHTLFDDGDLERAFQGTFGTKTAK